MMTHEIPSMPLPLTSFGCGCRVQLEFMTLEPDAACRMRDLGLREGACLSILQNDDKLICQLGGCRLGVQRELAMHLFGKEAVR